MLVGESGSGKLATANHMASQFLSTEKLENHPGFKLLTAENNSIGIDSIRTIQQFVRLKSTGRDKVRRVVIIEDAQSMTIEAQNAFLKLLEEPPDDTRIILTIITGQSVLPTIYSRVQPITIQNPGRQVISEFFKLQKHTTVDINKAYLLSGGQIGLMSALLNDDSNHPLLEYVDRAKQFLSMSAFERLAQLDNFAHTRDELSYFLQALKRMSIAAFEQAAAQEKSPQARHWHKIRSVTLAAEAMLTNSPNVKLLLTDLSLSV